MGRTLVIGDIHGGLRALQQVFERAAVSAKDILIFLGDYVDGWSESAQVMNFLLELTTQQSCVFIKGNHDVWCEEWLRNGHKDETWLAHGGAETLQSYEGMNSNQKTAHLELFEQMPFYFIDDKQRLFIHAGFTSMHGPQKEFQSPVFSWDRTLWETALALDKNIEMNSAFYPKRLRLFEEIYIGHTPTLYYEKMEPMHAANVWNLDTGAAFQGKLSMLDVDTKEIWQSDEVPELYPNEKGRGINK